jgi:UDP-glucose 4-epimerase
MVTFIEALLDGSAMEIHGDGQQTRTFTFVSDTVDAIVRALRTPESRSEVINVGGTETMSILDLAARIQRAMHIPQPLRANFVGYETLPGKYQDVRHRVPDTTKAQELLGFEAQVGVDDGLDATIAWHRERRASAIEVAAQA